MKNLELFTDKNIYKPGEKVNVIVTLRNDKPIKIRNIKLSIVGLEKTTIVVSHGKYSTTYHSHNFIINEIKYLEKGCEVPAGEHSYNINFQIPLEALPSYSGKRVQVNYKIKVRADVPFWFDVKTQKSFRVIYDSKMIAKIAKPVSFASENFNQLISSPFVSTGLLGRNKEKPSMQIEMDKNVFHPGGNIIGMLTLHNPTRRKIRKVDVILRAKEYAYAQGHQRYSTVEKHKSRIEMENIIEGIPSHFEIPVPYRARTCLLGEFSRCDWILEFNIDIALGFDVDAKQPIAIYKQH